MMNKRKLGCILYGGIGNRMFQYASAYALASKLAFEFDVAYVCTDSNHNIKVEDTCDLFEYDPKEIPTSEFDVRTYQSTLLRKGWQILMEPPIPDQRYVANMLLGSKSSKICIDGYMQHEDYFLSHRQTLLRKLSEPKRISEYLIKKYGSQLDDFASRYFIHVRLGDFYQNSYHFIDLNNYYECAIKTIRQKDASAEFIVFTEDTVNLPTVYPLLLKYPVINETNDLAGLYLITRCWKGGICPNSTYSWWGAWLNTNPNKHIILPDRFLAPEHMTRHLPMLGAVIQSTSKIII